MKNTISSALLALIASCSPPAWKETKAQPGPVTLKSSAREIRGRIKSAEGAPIARALVAAVDPPSYRALAISRTNQSGEFVLNVPKAELVVSATAQGYEGGSVRIASAVGRTEVTLKPTTAETRRFSGRVLTTSNDASPRVLVRVARWGWPPGRAYYAETDVDGIFSIELSMNESYPTMSYDVLVDDPGYISDFATTEGGYENLSLVSYPRFLVERPTTETTRRRIARVCHALDDREGALGYIAASAESARIIGLGEATHGTREFAEWRTRIIERLVVEEKLTTLSLEAGWEETLRIDDYVRNGVGTARDVVSSLRYFPWRTQEFVELVETLRGINAGRDYKNRVEFLGMEVDPPQQMADAILKRVPQQHRFRPLLERSIADVRRWKRWADYLDLDAQQRKIVKGNLAMAIRRIEKSRAPHDRGAFDNELVAYALSVMKMTVEGLDLEGAAFLRRDRLMAESQLLLLDYMGKRRQIALWAHDSHLAKSLMDGRIPLGFFLDRSLRDSYFTIATLFYEGSFLASKGPKGGRVAYSAPEPPEHFIERDLAATSTDTGCFVDFRAASKDALVKKWLERPRPLRVYGAFEISEHFPWPPIRLNELWSSLLFIRHSSPNRELEQPK
jgi:erythromycin esterase